MLSDDRASSDSETMKYVLSFVCLIAAFVVANRLLFSPLASDLPTLGTVSAFELENQDGETFRSSDLRGRVWLANFFFTSCDGPCPIASALLSRLQERFPKHLSLVSISVDPERDTTTKLRDYGDRFGASPAKWNLLRGPLETVSRLSQDVFNVGFGETAENHSTRFVLVDQAASIRGYYSSVDPNTFEQLEKDICSLLGSKDNC